MANNFNPIHKASSFFRNNNDSPLSDVQAQPTMQGILKNSDPSPDTPGTPLPTSPPKDIPRNILAFRTITKLLSHIQQEQAFQVSWDNPLPANDEELKLSTAFATIAVIDHEIVAVVTKHTCEKIQVVLTSQTPIKEPKRGIWGFLIAQNPRLKDAPLTSTNEPTISSADDAGILPGIDLNDDEILKTWVDQCW
jgi:hypothetical protein